jgi:hypothetical protein
VIISLSGLSLMQPALAIALAPLLVLLDNWRSFLLVGLDELDEVLSVDEYLALVLHLLSLEPIPALAPLLHDQVAVPLLLLRLAKVARLHGRLLRLVVLEQPQLLHHWRAGVVPPAIGQRLLELLALLAHNPGLAAVAVRLDDVEDVLRVGVGATGSIVAVSQRGDPDDAASDALAVGAEDVVGVLVVLELKVEVLHDFIGRLHLLLVALDLDVELGLHVDQLLDLGDVLHPAGPLLEKELQLEVLFVEGVEQALVVVAQGLKLDVHRLGMLNPIPFGLCHPRLALISHALYSLAALSGEFVLLSLQLFLARLHPPLHVPLS